MRFSTGQELELTAGATLPEMAVSVFSGGGQRMTRTATGERLAVTQRLWRLAPEGAAPAEAAAAGTAAAAAAEEGDGGNSGRAAKRQRKGRRGRGRQDENADPGGEGSGKAAGGGEAGGGDAGGGLPPGAELVLSVENKTPAKDVFQFARLADGLQRSGRYMLEYVAAPAAGGASAALLLRCQAALLVTPGPPCGFSVSGEGRAVAAVKDIALGEPPCTEQ